MHQDNEPLVSVIIPVYNVKEYLQRCVESVITQTYSSLEIWLVDDGSTDGSGEICDGYAAKDPRIKVIHKSNGGVSEARNQALDRISGSFVTFVDSDDYVRDDMAASLYSLIESSRADMAVSRIAGGTGSTFDDALTGPDDAPVIFEKDNVYESLFDESFRELMCAACGKLYRAELFRELRFPVGKGFEDEFTIHHILGQCRRIIISDKSLYYHYKRAGSATGGAYSLKSLEAVEALEDRYRFFEKKGDNRFIFLCCRDYLRRVQFHYYSLKKYYPEETERISSIKSDYRKRYNAIKKELKITERIRYGLFIWMPGLNRFLKSLAGARKI